MQTPVVGTGVGTSRKDVGHDVIQRQRRGVSHHLADPGEGTTGAGSQFLEAGPTSLLLLELDLHPLEPTQPPSGVASKATLATHRIVDGRTNPRRGIGGEADAGVRVEPLHGLNQTEESLLDEVIHRAAEAVCGTVGEVEHQAEVSGQIAFTRPLPLGHEYPQLAPGGGTAQLSIESGGGQRSDLDRSDQLVLLALGERLIL